MAIVCIAITLVLKSFPVPRPLIHKKETLEGSRSYLPYRTVPYLTLPYLTLPYLSRGVVLSTDLR